MRYTFSLLYVCLFLMAFPAFAQKTPDDLLPARGEVQVEGKVALVVPDETRLIVAVTRACTAGGADLFFDPPRLKTIQLRQATRWARSDESVATPTLAVLSEGAVVTAVGANSGSGKELLARLLLIDIASLEAARSAKMRADFSQAKMVLPRTASSSWWDLWLPKEGGAKVQGAREGNALKLTVVEPGNILPHIQLAQGDVPIENGLTYTVRFRARADTRRPVQIIAINGGGDRGRIGLEEKVEIDPQWRRYEVTFTAAGVMKEYRSVVPMFLLGGTKGDIWLSEIEVRAVGAQAAGTPGRRD